MDEMEVRARQRAALRRSAIIVVAYNSSDLLSRNLGAVSTQAPESLVVVVDNSTDELEQRRMRNLTRSRGWDLVAPLSNIGFGGGMNRGMEYARAKGATILVLLNPDATISRQDLGNLLIVVAESPMTMVSPLMTNTYGTVVADGTTLCLGDGTMRSRRSKRPIPPGGTSYWISGACLVLSTELLDLVGGFDERYFLYWEDVDLCTRVLEVGGELRVVRDSLATHDEGATHATPDQGMRAKSDTYYYYNVRNRLLYAALQLERAEQRRWAATSAAAAREIVLRGGKRQLLNSRSSLRAAWAGTRDGLHLLRQVRRGESPAEGVPLIREDSDNGGTGESSKASKNSRAGESRDAGWPEGPEGPEGPAGAASTQSPDSPESP